MPRHLAALSAMALSIVPQLVWATTYTREEAVNIALEKSSDVKTAEQELISANSQVDAGYGNALPSIDLSASVMRIFGLDDVKNRMPVTNALAETQTKLNDGSEASAYDYVNAGAIDGLIYGMSQQGYRWQSSVGLTATQILYAQGKVGTGIEIAKAYKHVKEVSLENTKSNIRYNVENAFDQLIFLDSSITILHQGKDLLQENLNFVEQGLKSGMQTELDLIRVQLKMDQLNSEITSTEKQRILARNALLNTMGLDWETDVQFKGDLRDPQQGYAYPDTSMANVKKRRKELVMLQASEEMLDKNVSIEQGGYKPTIVLVGGLKYTNNKNHFYQWDAPDWDDNINKYVGLNLTMNLFNGMKTKEAVVQAKSDLRSAQIKKETVERGFRVQIESCANSLEDANTQIEIAKRQIDLAQKNYDLTNDSYKLGRETQLNLLSAENDLRTAKLGYMRAIVNWNQAYNALLQATGEY
ncbi:MAG: TolC family protein [Fibrobacter sp.]|nr:TolC family protein [Fibrobacter sp.]